MPYFAFLAGEQAVPRRGTETGSSCTLTVEALNTVSLKHFLFFFGTGDRTHDHALAGQALMLLN